MSAAAPGARRPVRRLLGRLRATYALLLTLLVVVDATGAGAVLVTNAQLAELGGRLEPAIQANEDVLRSMLDAETTARGHC